MGVITLTGPSCAGKSTVERVLRDKFGCGVAISHTTRAPWPGEVDGVHYHFVTEGQFHQSKAAGEFIETIEFGSKRYAMAASSLQQALHRSPNVVIVVEPVGAAQILDYCDQHDIGTLSCWLDCDPLTQATRWLERVDTLDQAGTKANAERLALMLTTEAGWRANAAVGKVNLRHRYRYINTDTERMTPEQLAESIMFIKELKW